MAHGTIGEIRWRLAGRGQGWKQRSAKVVMTSAKAHHHICPVRSLHIHAVVYAMNQQVEVDALRIRGPIGGNGRRGARRCIGIRRIVAHHAIFGVVAKRAVELQRYVATVAVAERHDRTAILYG